MKRSVENLPNKRNGTGIIYFITLGNDKVQVNESFYKILEPIIEKFPSTEEGPGGLSILFMKNFLLFSSQEIFQNVKVIPFIGSVSLVFLTYFLIFFITKKRFS